MGLIYFYLAKEPLCPVIPAHCLLSLQQVLRLICVSAPLLKGYLRWVIGHLDNIAGKKAPPDLPPALPHTGSRKILSPLGYSSIKQPGSAVFTPHSVQVPGV